MGEIITKALSRLAMAGAARPISTGLCCCALHLTLFFPVVSDGWMDGWMGARERTLHLVATGQSRYCTVSSHLYTVADGVVRLQLAEAHATPNM